MSIVTTETDIKRPGPNWSKNIRANGGNKLMQRFRLCAHCKKEFGPLTRLSRQYCSKRCAYDHRGPRVNHVHVPNKAAQKAYKKMAWAIQSGRIIRPIQCEECGVTNKRIEAAHHDYLKPYDVRWLCRSCHVRWDSNEPKGGTKTIERWQKYTGREAVREDGVKYSEL